MGQPILGIDPLKRLGANLLRHKTFTLILGLMTMFAAGGIVSGQTSQNAAPKAQSDDVVVQTTATVPTQAVPVTPSPAPGGPTVTPPEPAPLSPAEQKAADNKAALDKLLAEAAGLKASYEDYKRGRSKTQVSLSAFRSLELRLQMAAAANPANGQANDMANMMRMMQYSILQPSVQIAAVANRQLYVHEMSERMRDDGMRVEASGRENNTVRFMSPHMSRQMAMQLIETAKIPDQAKALQFSRVVFSSGRRSWTYDVARGRLR
jgi:hypothetical protein